MQLNRRMFVRGAAAVTAGISLGAVMRGKANAQGVDTIRVAFSARGLRTIDPHRSIQGVDNWAIIALYDKLVDLPRWRFPEDVDGLVPRLATSWSMSEDARAWTFELRQGVQFHNGYGEMTSDDVKFSFDRALDGPRVDGVRSKFLNIESVETDGDYRVIFNLRQPDPLFPLGALSDYDASIFSRRAVEEIGEEEIGTNPVGTGPYVLETIHTNPTDGLTLAANPDFWGDAPVTPRIQCRYIADTTARTLALLSGHVHMIEGVRAPGWADSMRQRDPNLIFDVVSPGSSFTLHMNLTQAPLDDIRVRQAIFYAIDRNEITSAIAPISLRTYGLNPPTFPGAFTEDTIPEEVAYDYDPDRARALLAEAGHESGLRFSTDTSQREDYSAIMLMIQDQLRRVGIDMQLNIKDHTAFHADQNIATNLISQTSAVMPPVPTHILLLYLRGDGAVTSDGQGGSNFSRYGVAMPGIDELMDQALAEPDLERRFAITQQIEVQALRDAVVLPIATNGFMMVRSPSLDLGFEVESGYVNWPLAYATVS